MARAMWSWDPNGRHEWRYHDGQKWTDHVSDDGTVSPDPYDPNQEPEHVAMFKKAEYLGGHARLGEPRAGRLFISPEAIGIGDVTHNFARVPTSDIASIEIAGGQVAVSQLSNVLAFGVLGLGSKRSKHQTSLGVRTRDSEVAYYLIDDAEPVRVRAQLTPFLKTLSIPFFDEVS